MRAIEDNDFLACNFLWSKYFKEKENICGKSINDILQRDLNSQTEEIKAKKALYEERSAKINKLINLKRAGNFEQLEIVSKELMESGSEFKVEWQHFFGH